MNKPRAKLDRELERQRQLADIQNAIPKELKDIAFAVKQADERVLALFSKVHNLQVDMSGLTSRLDKMLALLVEILHSPDNVTEAQAVIRDFLNQSLSQNNRKST